MHSSPGKRGSDEPTSVAPEPEVIHRSRDAETERSRGELIGPRLLQIRAVRDGAFFAGIGLLVFYSVNVLAALLPVLLGFFGAYLVAPAVRWFEARSIRRSYVVLGTSLLFTGATAFALVLLLPRFFREIKRLRDRIPDYLEVVGDALGVPVSEALRPLDLEATLGALDHFQPLLGVLGSLIGTTASTLLFVILFLASVTVFTLEFDNLPRLIRYVPSSQREKFQPSSEVVVQTFRGFLRGQLVVMLFTGGVYTTGFALLGVPYGVVAGLVGGILSIIPYGQLAGPLLAVTFNLLESQVSGELDPFRALFLPALVYAIMQSLESFVVTPLIQGAATRLHPLAILAALAAGGSLGGIAGVFLAIPLTASAWIIAKEHVFPAWRRWAEQH